MAKQNISLKDVEKSLLESTVCDLLNKLPENEEADTIHVKQAAFDYWSDEKKEAYQVQVIITRCQSDFMAPFQTEYMTNYMLD